MGRIGGRPAASFTMRQTPILGLSVPPAPIAIVHGWRGVRETRPAAVVCALVLATGNAPRRLPGRIAPARRQTCWYSAAFTMAPRPSFETLECRLFRDSVKEVDSRDHCPHSARPRRRWRLWESPHARQVLVVL